MRASGLFRAMWILVATAATFTACETPSSSTQTVCVVGTLEIDSIEVPALSSTPCPGGGAGSPDATIDGSVEGSPGTDEGGGAGASLEGAAGEPAPPSLTTGSSDIWFVAQAYAPPGTWVLTVTASGSLAVAGTGDDAGAPPIFSQMFTSLAADGGTQILVPIATTANGLATITTTVGPLTQQFLFTVASPPSAAQSSCIAVTGVSVLAWAVQPPPPPQSSEGCTPANDSGDDGSCPVIEAGPPVATLIVDVRVTVLDCSTDAGVPGATVAVSGTGGLEPTMPTFTTDSTGVGAFELRGPDLLNTATAVLTYGSGFTTVCVVQDASCPGSAQ